MRLLRLPSFSRAALAWVAALALLLPVAQLAAVWHACTHLVSQASPDGDHPSLPHLAHCDLCLTVAGLDSGGAAAQAHASPLAPPGSDTAAAVPVSGLIAAPVLLAYLSRAPPLTPR